MFRKLLIGLLLLLAAQLGPLYAGSVVDDNGVISTGGSGGNQPGAGCAEATQAMARLDGSQNTSVLTTMICGLVSDGVWTKFDAFYFLATNSNGNARTNLVSSSFGASVVGSPTFAAAGGGGGGYTIGDAASGTALDTGYNASTAGLQITINAGHAAIWSNTNAASSAGGGNDLSALNNAQTAGIQVVSKYVDGNLYARLNDASAAVGAIADSRGLFTSNRSGASATQGYQNTTLVGSPNTASVALPNATITIGASNREGVGIGGGSGRQIMFASFGASLTGTNVSNLCARLNVALQAIAGITNYAGC